MLVILRIRGLKGIQQGISPKLPYCYLFKRVPILANFSEFEKKSLIIVRANKDHRLKNPMNTIKVIQLSARCAGV